MTSENEAYISGLQEHNHRVRIQDWSSRTGQPQGTCLVIYRKLSGSPRENGMWQERQNQRTEAITLVTAVTGVYICRCFYTLQNSWANISFAPLVMTLQRKHLYSNVID